MSATVTSGGMGVQKSATFADVIWDLSLTCLFLNVLGVDIGVSFPVMEFLFTLNFLPSILYSGRSSAWGAIQ